MATVREKMVTMLDKALHVNCRFAGGDEPQSPAGYCNVAFITLLFHKLIHALAANTLDLNCAFAV